MDQQRNWLALVHAHLGSEALDQLLEQFGDAHEILHASRSSLSRLGISVANIDALLRPDEKRIEADLTWLQQPNHHLICRNTPLYPPLLGVTPGAPAALYVDGEASLLTSPQLAIVGSRTPTHSGRDNARSFAAHLAGCGLTITSGMAAGIDSCAHAGALQKHGLTVAVCGTGLDEVYPAECTTLAAEIRQHGVLVSEFPPGTPPRRQNFPQRNRIIAGLSLGTLVVEAAHRSGSLITAHRAIDYGREVFAIPGSIHNPLSRGCHRLIREGAKLIESAGDILDELAPVFQAAIDPETAAQQPESGHAELDVEYRKLLEYIGYEPTQIDTMVERSGLTANAVSSMLLVLELRGYVSPAAGGGYSRTSKRLSE
ncbi:MAG: DNA-processing protein DprA [Gammaproteobacteria bacterium]|nr:DNA-processing protein DprA [Gammaproteobacteria bacterium]MDH3769279.1 DNA-processing protein DprA [Gammaproteobacteria bacterium]